MEYKVLRQDKRGPIREYVKIEGENVLDAVKKNFEKLLEISTYHSVPFRYPITVTPGADAAGKVVLKLEWMWEEYRNKPAIPQSYKIHLDVDASELPNLKPFVMEGN